MARVLLRDLMQGRAYKVQVRAVSDRETGPWSRMFDLTTTINPQAPDAPSFLGVGGFVADGTAFTASWNSINLALDQNLDFSHYDLELTANSKTFIFQTTNTTFTLTLEQNRTLWTTPQPIFSARLRSVDLTGNVSAWVGPTTATNPVPDAPATITAVGAVDQVSLKWDGATATDIVGYRVYVGATSGFTPTPANKIFDGNALNFSYTTTTYSGQWFKVAAVDVFGQISTYTTTAAAVSSVSPFIVDTTPPANPVWTAGTITNNSDGIGSTVALTWTQTSVTDLAGFEIRYRKVGDINWDAAGRFEYSARAATIALPLAYINYELSIRSFDFSNNSSAWVPSTITSPANAIPSVVTGLVSAANRDSMRYTWNASVDADLKNYEVTFSTSNTFASGNITFLTGTANYLDIGGLTPGTTYYTRVRANDTGSLSSAFSATDTRATLTYSTYTSDGVAPASSPAATVTGGIGFLHVQWPSIVNNDLVTYEVHISTTNAFTPVLGTKVAETPSTTIILEKDATAANLVYNTTYYIKLIAKDRDGSASAGTQGSASPLKVTSADSTLTAGDVGAPTNAQFATAIKTTVNEYAVNSSETVAPDTITGGWSTTQPARTAGTFVWFRTKVTYQDNNTNTSAAALLTGNTGATGTAGTPAAQINLTATTQVLVSPSAGGTTNPTTSTVTGVATNTTITVWTYSVDGATFSATVPAGVSRSANVVTITGSTMTARTIAVRMTDTADIADTLTVAKTFDGATGSTGTAGTNGTNGVDGYTVLLTNEAQVFPGTTSAATAGSATSGVIAYKGGTQIASTINSFGTTPTGMSVVATNNGTTTTGFTVTVTTALVQQSGSFVVNLTVDGKTFTQMFSWSVAYTGAQGTTGTTGTAGTNGTNGTNGVSITSVTPHFQTVTPIGVAAPAQPSTNPPGGSWVTTEPTYAANTELYRTELIVYSNATFVYTTVTKVSAYTAAAAAMTTANSKNKVIRNTAAPSGTGYVDGDLWFQYSGTNLATGTIIGQWLYDGTANSWLPQTIRNEVIATLDAAKVTTGFLDAARIQAQTVSVQKLIVTDFSNLIEDGGFEKGASGWTLGGGASVATLAAGVSPNGGVKVLQVASSGAISDTNSYSIPVSPGETWYAEAWVRKTTTGVAGNVNIAASLSLEGTTNFSYPVFGLASTAMSSLTQNTWVKIGGRMTIPAGTNRMLVRASVRNDVPTGEIVQFDNIILRKAMNAELVVDGSIRADALTTGSLAAAVITLTTGGIIKTAGSEVTITSSGITVTSGATGGISTSVLTTGTFAAGQALTVNGNMLLNGNMQVQTGGYIKSTNYTGATSAAGSTNGGWYLGQDGLRIVSGIVAADSLAPGTFGGTNNTGTINIAANAIIQTNGGAIKSNTFNGTLTSGVYNNDASAGYYLDSTNGLIVATGKITANALVTGTVSTASISLTSTGEIKSGGYVDGSSATGFRLTSAGLEIPNGTIIAAKLQIQDSANIVLPHYASFESATLPLSPVNIFATIATSTASKFGTQHLATVWTTVLADPTLYLGSSTTDYNTPFEVGETYILSAYARVQGAVATTVRAKIKWDNGTTSAAIFTANPTTGSATWTRYSGTVVALTDNGLAIFDSPIRTANAGFDIDGFQIERKQSALTTPSPWKAPGMTTVNGGLIKTGTITSNNTALITLLTPTYDDNGNQVGFGHPTTITDPNGRPAFNINTTGDAEFSNMLIRGNVTVGVPSGGATGDTSINVSIVLGITSASKNFTAADGTFVQADIGQTITGTGIPAGTTIMSVTSEGTAGTLSANATVTNAALTASMTRPARYASYLRSANYTEGVTGWILRSDGTAELRELAYDSLDGGAIRVGTLRAESIASGSIESAITISGSFDTAYEMSNVTLTITSASTSITRTDGGTWDTVQDINAGIIGVGIPEGTKILSVTSSTVAVMSSPATVSATGRIVKVTRGRKVSIAASGISLLDASGESVVNLPTDANQPATFTGSIVATDIFVQDEFRMFGKNNSLGQGAELNMNSGTYASPKPKITFSYDSLQMTSGPNQTDYNPSTDEYVNNPTGFCWDDTEKKYLFTFGFYGAQVARHWGPGNTFSARDGQQDWGVGLSGALDGGVAEYAYGGMKVVGNDFYFMTKNVDTNAWRLQRITRTGMNRSGGPVPGDRTLNNVWLNSGSLNGNPAFDVYGGNVYVAKLNNTNQITLYKYSGTNVQSVATFATVKDTAAGSIASLNVGTFDMGTTVYAVVTTQDGNSETRKNYVYTVGTSAFVFSDLNFPLAGGYNTIGTAWVGTSTADTNGYFRSLGQAGAIYTYTKFAATNTASIIYSTSKWRNTTLNTYGPESSIVTSTVQRRAKTVISAGSSIPNVGGTSPNGIAFYMSSISTTRYRLELPATNVTSAQVDAIPTSGTFAETAMAAGVPSKILSGDYLEISGNGYIKTNRIWLASAVDANTSAGNTPPLLVGDFAGNHMRIDGNEIISMASDTTQGTLFLNGGGQVNLFNLNVSGAILGTTQMTNINLTGGFTTTTNFNGPTKFNDVNNDFVNAPTTTNSVNVNFNSSVNNRIRLVTSLSQFKVNKQIITLDEAKGLLAVTPQTWYDRTEWENNGNKPDGLRRIPGVVAQDIETNAPMYATYDEGTLNGVAYDRMASGLLVIIKSHEQEINTLKTAKASLEARVAAIEARLGP